MCYSLAKYFFFAFNFVFWLAGAGILGVGIWLNVDPNVANTVEVAGLEFYYAGAIVLIVAGCIMLVVGFFGCCGAIKESTCLLGTYFGFLIVILGLEVGIGIWALVTYPDLGALIDDSMDSLDYSVNEDNPLVAMEQNLECCGGTEGCSDWTGAGGGSYGCGCDPATAKNISNCVPVSRFPGCTMDQNPNTNPSDTVYIYGQPCSVASYNFIEDNFQIIGIVALVIGCTQVIGLIISMCLCCSIKKKKKGGYPA